MPTIKGDAATILADLERRGLVHAPRVADRPPVPAAKVLKYRNHKVEFEGMEFDSKKEFRRYLDLREQQRAGHIRGLERQVAFPIMVQYTPICEYVADFVYSRGGVFVIEDVKSKATRTIPVYRLKIKLMAALGMAVTEV